MRLSDATLKGCVVFVYVRATQSIEFCVVENHGGVTFLIKNLSTGNKN